MSGYLSATDKLDFVSFIQAPPASDSFLFAQDAAAFEEGRSSFGSDAWNALLVKVMEGLQPGVLFNEVLGIEINQHNTPVTYGILEKIEQDYRLINGRAKAHFSRPSPYRYFNLSMGPILAGGEINNQSYPSGHGNFFTMSALLLASVFPKKTTELLSVAHQRCNDVVRIGLHWRTDIEVGKFLGAVLFNHLLSKRAFKADLRACKQELTALVK